MKKEIIKVTFLRKNKKYKGLNIILTGEMKD